MARKRRKIRAGMNIDHGVIRMVVVNGNDEVIWYGEENLTADAVVDGFVHDPAHLADKMGELLKKSKVKSRQVVIAWAPNRCLYRTMPMPAGAGRSVHQALVIDAEAQLAPIDPSLLQLHVYQRPEEGAAVYAYDRAALASLIEAAHLARVKIQGLYHPVAGLLSFAEGGLCYLGEGASYYAEGDVTPSYLRTLAVGANEAPVARDELFTDGVASASEWVDELGQDILTTRHQVFRQLGKASERIFFTGPTLAVPQMGRYLKSILATAKLGTLKLPYKWPDNATPVEKALYSGALGALSAPSEANILSDRDVQANPDTDSEIAEGGIRIETQIASQRWLIGLAGMAMVIILLGYGGSVLFNSMEDKQNEKANAYAAQTHDLASSGKVQIIGPQDWIEQEAKDRKVWTENKTVRDYANKSTELWGILNQGGLNLTGVKATADGVEIVYSGDDKLLAGILEPTDWKVKKAEEGKALLRMRRFIYIGTAAIAVLVAWIFFLAPAFNDYRTAHQRVNDNKKTLEVAKKTGYRVSKDDISRLSIADSDEWSTAVSGTNFSIVKQSREGLQTAGGTDTLDVLVKQASGDNITIDPIYGVMQLPAEIAPIIPLEEIEIDYYPGNQAAVVINGIRSKS